MSGRHAREAPTLAEHLAQQRRRATWIAILGAVVTVLGLTGLVLTEPVSPTSSGHPRTWAVGVLLIGLGTTVAALISRVAPAAERRPMPPSRPAWLLLALAACGLVTLVATARSGAEDPLRYLSPVLLTLYPLALYGYQARRYRRFTNERAQAARPS